MPKTSREDLARARKILHRASSQPPAALARDRASLDEAEALRVDLAFQAVVRKIDAEEAMHSREIDVIEKRVEANKYIEEKRIFFNIIKVVLRFILLMAVFILSMITGKFAEIDWLASFLVKAKNILGL